MKKISSRIGFTLVELLLVAAMLAAVGMAVYGAFVRGISIWQRVSQPANTENVGVFFKNISYDLRNSFKMASLKFHGEEARISFPTRIEHHQNEGAEDSIGLVTYSFKRRDKALYKSQADYSTAYLKKPGDERMIADGISSLQFEYYVYDAERKKYSWVTNWQDRDSSFGVEVEKNLPLIVDIEVGVPSDGKEQIFKKSVFIPSACCWPFIDDEENE
ncbi:MAG: hypothetical protein JW847_06700 [Candidatus Omnitrophica bacterium]|nr:hypothetical protein [Candidatus Omnitrophota bacterium]